MKLRHFTCAFLDWFGLCREHAPPAFPTTLPAWLTVVPLSTVAQQRAAAWQQSGLLHSGEAEALALAEEFKRDWFLTDDAAARLMAESLSLSAHGSLGVVLWCAAQHLIPKLHAELHLTNLETSSLWLSPASARKHARLWPNCSCSAPQVGSQQILSFYMGKNTPERKDYIMENLMVTVEE